MADRTFYTTAMVRACDLRHGDIIKIGLHHNAPAWREVLNVFDDSDQAETVLAGGWYLENHVTGQVQCGEDNIARRLDSGYTSVLLQVVDTARSDREGEFVDACILTGTYELIEVQVPVNA